jgi:CheY-like chemotaxis protein
MRNEAIDHDLAFGQVEATGACASGITGSEVGGEVAQGTRRGCILIVETDAERADRLAHALRGAGYDVMGASTGEQAFRLLRDRQRPIEWLYTRAALPGLIDGWLLADQHRDNHPDRPAIIGAREARLSARGDIVLREPEPEDILSALRSLTGSRWTRTLADPAGYPRGVPP